MISGYISAREFPSSGGGDVLTLRPRFFKMLGSDEMRAWYGPDHVRLAADRGAVGTLLISDELFRCVRNFPGSLGWLPHMRAQSK